MKRTSFLLASCLFLFGVAAAQSPPSINVIGYYAAGPEKVDSLDASKLTHIIFSFCHLKGNKLTVDNSRDSLTIVKLVQLKKKNPSLKIILSLGGWGGCQPCSDVFSTTAGRSEFAQSVKQLSQQYHTDGLDLDWEYPAIEGYPGHAFKPEDKNNFTELVSELRKTLGSTSEISFAAGGFEKFLKESIEWNAVMPLIDRVNLMTYDLVNGYSTQTGHHTALYSRAEQKESTDNCVQYLVRAGIPRDKLVIGAAFYGRMWENVPSTNHGLYQSGKFKSFVPYSNLSQLLTQKNYTRYWDKTVKAPYLYNAVDKLFVTYDDAQSMKLKTQYAIDQKLDGIMFWELSNDAKTNSLLDAIDRARKKN